MKITQEISSRVRGVLDAFSGKTASKVSAAGQAFADVAAFVGRMFKVGTERNVIHHDMHRMDRDDELAQFALNTIASRTTGMEDPKRAEFEVNVSAEDAPDGKQISDSQLKQAQWEISQLIRRLGLKDASWQIVRSFVKYGNEFRALAIDPDARDIVKFAQRPEHTMWPNIDKNGDRLPGYVQKANSGIGISADAKFEEWEIVHFAFGEIDGYLGTPLLGSARKNWKRLNLAEDSTAAARLLRAFMKMIHKVPVDRSWTPKQQLDAINTYKEGISKLPVFNQNAENIENSDWPQTVKTDFFIPDDGTGRGGVEMLDPENAQLQNIADIEHFMNRFICATTIPKRYFPFEGSTPKLSEGGGNAEDTNFACTLIMAQNILKKGYAELFDRQLILKGINPTLVRYDFRMADINVVNQLRDAQTKAALANAMNTLLQNYPELRNNLNVILREYTKMSDASYAELADVEIKEKPAETEPTPPVDDRTQLPGMGNKEAKTKV
jgi:hypothetical protein